MSPTDVTVFGTISEISKKGYLSPEWPLVRHWQNFVGICVLVTCCLDPFIFAFDTSQPLLWGIAYFLDAVVLIDIVSQFFTAYNNKGKWVTDLKSIRKHYMWAVGAPFMFSLDIVSLLPIEALALALPATYRAWSGLRLNRLIRFYRVGSLLAIREEELSSDTSHVRFMRYGVMCFVTMHWLSCGWNMLACLPLTPFDGISCYADTWASSVNGSEDLMSTGERYIRSLYWGSATVTSTGYGELSATNLEERWFAVLTMLAGISVFFGMLLGGLTSMLTNLDSQRATYVHRLQSVMDQMKELRIAKDLQNLVSGYYNYMWISKMGVQQDDIFAQLPLCLQAEVSRTTNRSVLEKASIFKDIDEGFLRMLSLNIHQQLYLPGQVIISRGDTAHSLFFVHRGTLEVLSDKDDETPVATLREGKVFGEVSLIFSLPRSATVRAITHCELMTLEKVNVQKVLEYYPEVSERLTEMALKRCTANVDSTVGKHQVMRAAEEPETMTKVKYSNARKLSVDLPAKRRQSMAMHGHEKNATVVNISSSVDIIESHNVPVSPGASRRQIIALITNIQRFLQGRTIDPGCMFSRLWNKYLVVLIVFIFILYSYVACFPSFDTSETVYETVPGRKLLIVTYFFDLLLVLDIIIQLRTGVATANGILVDFASIKKNYVFSMAFVLDILAVLPLEVICLAVGDQHRWHLLCFLRLNRLLKFRKVIAYISSLEDKLDVDISSVRTKKFAIYILCATHFCACLLYFAASAYGVHNKSSWLFMLDKKAQVQAVPEEEHHEEEEEEEEEEEIGGPRNDTTVYMLSLYWAATTMSSTGYGDLYALTTLGQIIASFVMIIGLLLYGYILAAIAALKANDDSARVQYQTKLMGMKAFMLENNLHEDLRVRVVEYMKLLWSRYRGEAEPGTARNIFRDVPVALQQDIAIEDAEAHLLKLPLFQEMDVGFMRLLAQKAHLYAFNPGEIIVYAGDLAREMYCVRRGLCEFLTDDLKKCTATISTGQCFGEIGVLFDDYCPATVRAKTYVELIMVRRQELHEVCQQFPAIQSQFTNASQHKEVLEKIKKEDNRRNRDSQTRVRSVLDMESKPGRREEEDVEVTAHFKSSFKVHTKYHPDGTVNEDFMKPFRRGPGRFFGFILMRITLLPNSRFVVGWEMMRVILAMLNTFTVPIHGSLLIDSNFLWFLSYLMDVITIVDMYVKLHVCYFDANDRLITHPLLTAKRYIKSNLWIDIVTIFPFEFLAYSLHPELDLNGMHVLTLFRINRLLHFYRLPLAFDFLESGVEFDTVIVRELKYLFYAIISINWVTCLLFNFACPPNPEMFGGHTEGEEEAEAGSSCSPTSWLAGIKFTDASANVYTQYVNSLYWACATTLSVGYGDILPLNLTEVGLCILLMVGGVVFFGYIIASIAASLANAETQRASYLVEIYAMKQYMKDEGFDQSLQSRVIDHFQYLWIRTKGIDPTTLFEGLPMSLLGDVSLSLYNEFINKVPEFKGTDIGFCKMIAMCMKPMYIRKGEYLVRKHDIGNEMFFIRRGLVSVVSEDNSRIFDTMTSGQFFGEVGILYGTPRNASIRAETNCDLFVLSKASLDDVLAQYPEVKKQVYKTAEDRREAARQRSVMAVRGESIPTKELPIVTTGGVQDVSRNIPADNQGLFRRVIHYNSALAIWTNYADCVASLLSCILISYQASYDDQSTGIYVIGYLFEIVILFKVFLKFRTSYLNKHGEEELDFDVLYKNYLYNPRGFAYDALAFLPLDIFAAAGGAGEKLTLLSKLRVIHLLRIPRILQHFSNWEEELQTNILLVRLGKFTTLLGLMIHHFSCCWYVIACVSGDCGEENNWVTNYDVLQMTPLSRYVSSLYWCVASMTSTGYGDVHAYTIKEMLYSSLVMVVGKLSFGFVLGNIASTLANQDRQQILYDDKIAVVKTFMKSQLLPGALRHRVMAYFSLLWNYNKGVSVKRIIAGLPYCMRGEIMMKLGGPMLKKVKLFRNVDDSFFRMLSLKLTHVPFMPGQYILHKGDMGQEMYFVHRGQVAIVPDENEPQKTVAVLQPGDHFGELCIVYHAARRMSVRAETNVELFILTQEDVVDVFRFFPLVAQQVKQIGKEEFGSHVKGSTQK